MSVIVLKLHIFVFFSETFVSIGKLKIYLHKLQKQVEKQAFVELFCPISQWVQINYIFSNNVHILCLSYHIKKTKTTAKLTRKNRNKLILIFDCVLCKSLSYTVTVSYCRSTWIRNQKNYILISDCI